MIKWGKLKRENRTKWSARSLSAHCLGCNVVSLWWVQLAWDLMLWSPNPISLSLSLSLSLSPSHTTTFSFNVRVGFLSYLPNWNLLSGSGGGWWVTPVWVVMRTHLLSLSPASLYSLLPFSRPLLLPHYQPLIFPSNIIHNFTHNFPLFPFTSPSCFQFLPNFILSHLTRPSRLTVFYGRKKGSHNFFRIFF